MSDLSRDAYAVLLPAFGDCTFDPSSVAFFNRGGVAALLGSTRDEYVARRMSIGRRGVESATSLADYARSARELAGNVLIAVDYEIGGVHRLHDNGPQLSHPRDVLQMSEADIHDFAADAARAALGCGVNFFLSPVVDLVTGENPWLRDRTFSTDPEAVGRVATTFIRSVQSHGVVATAKHFPGHPHVPVDPYDSSTVTVSATMEELLPGLSCYRKAISAGVRAIMTGPIPVDAIDPHEPASCSARVVSMLREEFNFDGLIVSDDVDLPGTLRGRSVEDVTVTALNAGVELILLAAGPQVDRVVARIVQAVEARELGRDQLSRAANKVRALAARSPQI